MASVVFAEDRNLYMIKKLVETLCEASEVDSHDVRISSISSATKTAKSQIIVINNLQRSMDLSYALNSLVAGGTLILDADERNYTELSFSKPVRLITYGYNPISTLRATYVTNGTYTSLRCHIQRSFFSIEGHLLEPQEFILHTAQTGLPAKDVLAAVSVALLCGVDVPNITAISNSSEELSFPLFQGQSQMAVH